MSDSKQHTVPAAFFLALIILTYFLAVPVRQKAQLEDDLIRAARMFRIGYAAHIAIQDYTDFDWEQVYIFPPDTPDHEIIARLGFYWPQARTNQLRGQSNTVLLVFTQDRSVIRWAEIPRAEADFTSVAERGPFTPQNGLFFFPREDSPELQVLR